METNSDEFNQAVVDAVAKEVERLKATNVDLKDEKTLLSGQLSESQQRLAKYASAEADREKKAATRKGDWDALEVSLKDHQAKELEVRDTRITALTTSLRSEILEKRAVEAIAAAGGSAKVLKPHILSALSIHEEDGQFIAVVVDEKGNPRLTVDAKTATDYMTVGEYVETLKSDPEFAGVFGGTGAGGGGATASQSTGSRSGPKTVDRNDPVAMGKLAAKIATGEVEVV